MNLRKIIFWLHLISGVVAGTVILVMSVTGVLLAFERQIVAFAERDTRTITPPASDAPRLSLDSLVANARKTVPAGAPSGITLSADPTAATMVNFGREQTVFVDPYTGAVWGKGRMATRDFFRVVTDWHRWLGTDADSRELGRAVTGACNAAFMVLVMSGFYLWWPRRWTRLALKTITIPSLSLRGKPRDWNWHNAMGFWSAPVLLFITVTGLVISYQWAGNLLYTFTGSEPPPPPQQAVTRPEAEGSAGRGGAMPGALGSAPDGRAGRQPRVEGANGTERRGRATDSAESSSAPARASLDALFAMAARQAPLWRLMTMRLQQRGMTQVIIMIEEADSLHPYPRSTLTLDATTARVMKWEPFADYNLGRTIRLWVRPVHTGEAGGFIGQFIAALASSGGAVLVYTGLALAWRRLWQFVKRHRRAGGAAPDEHRDIAPSQAS
jgi:uncharacterized iron-regulated membrane protein